jgi:hypothetical protein
MIITAGTAITLKRGSTIVIGQSGIAGFARPNLLRTTSAATSLRHFIS